MSDLLGMAANAAGTLYDNRDKIEDATKFGLDIIAKFMKGCEPASKIASDLYVYFVTEISGQNLYVRGCMMDEHDKIIKFFNEGFTHVIFLPAKSSDYGIQQPAAGEELYSKYLTCNAAELCRVRYEDPKHTYLACLDDVYLFRLRLNTAGIGCVYDRSEIRSICSEYLTRASHQRFAESVIIYQMFLDLAVKHRIK